ncbi:hypothetical protein DFJ73DRAFT_839022, partial [Zopfochytrium polystomum]
MQTLTAVNPTEAETEQQLLFPSPPPPRSYNCFYVLLNPPLITPPLPSGQDLLLRSKTKKKTRSMEQNIVQTPTTTTVPQPVIASPPRLQLQPAPFAASPVPLLQQQQMPYYLPPQPHFLQARPSPIMMAARVPSAPSPQQQPQLVRLVFVNQHPSFQPHQPRPVYTVPQTHGGLVLAQPPPGAVQYHYQQPHLFSQYPQFSPFPIYAAAPAAYQLATAPGGPFQIPPIQVNSNPASDAATATATATGAPSPVATSTASLISPSAVFALSPPPPTPSSKEAKKGKKKTPTPVTPLAALKEAVAPTPGPSPTPAAAKSKPKQNRTPTAPRPDATPDVRAASVNPEQQPPAAPDP